MTNKETQNASTNNPRPGRLLAAVAVATLLIAALASIWRLLAAQSPSSPLHLGPLVGPVESLALACWTAGFGGVALTAAMKHLVPSDGPVRRIVALLVIGWLFLLSGLIVGACLGTTGTQIINAYPRTVVVLMLKLVGFLATVAGFVSLLRAVVRGSGRGRGSDRV